MEKKLSDKSKKSEILDAYHKLLSKIENKTEEPKVIQQRLIKEENLKQISGISTNSIMKKITDLKISASGVLDNMSEQMVATFKEFEQVKEAVKIEKDNLEELYQITTNAHSLAALIAAQKEQKEDFDAEMSEKKNIWQEKEIKKQQEIKEAEDALKKARKRDEEEYQYNLKINRKKDQDTYEEKKTSLEKQLAEKKTTFEKEISERESAVKETENELNELRKKTAEFPKILETELEKLRKETEKELKRQYDFEKQLSESQNKAEQQLKTQTIETLKAKIKDQETLINQLTQKVNSSENNVKQIAMKAMETSSKERVITVEKENKE